MKTVVKIAVVCFVAILAYTPTARAQSVGSILSSIKNGVSSSSKSDAGSVKSTLTGIIGTKKVSASSLIGTWSYKEPAIAFESANMASKVGGSVISNKIESELQDYLSKAGITPGQLKITFNADSTFTSTLKGRTVKGKYSLNGATITFRRAGNSAQAITANVKVGSTLQITFKTDKLLAAIQQLSAAAGTANSTLKTIATLSKSYSGMQVGMMFSKSKK